jgi:hypothetical protein
MYIAQVRKKEETTQGLRIHVDFVNGETIIKESVIPQDRAGFDYWIKSRLATHNAGLSLKNELVDGEEVVINETVVEEVPLTADELAFQEWQTNYWKLQQVQKLIDLDVLTGSETPVTNLRNKVKTDFKVAYIDAL